ncbi:MAG: hypothetical protein ACREJO_18890 [Phycisphaerales bacterium]
MIDEISDRRATLVPVVDSKVELGPGAFESPPFRFKYPGRYSVHIDLKLRAGPGTGPYRDLPLSGVIEIRDASGNESVRHRFRTALASNLVSVEVARLQSGDAKCESDCQLMLRFDELDPELVWTYASAGVWMRRDPWSVLTY